MMMLPNNIFSLVQFFTLLYLFTVTFASTEETTSLLKWKSTFKNQNNSLLSSWRSSSNACWDWYGVICFNGRVNRLNITNFSVICTLYDFPFSSLSFLQYLSINRISGTIPPQIGSLAKLEILHIFDNHLNGSIPNEIGYLRSLTELALSRNFLNVMSLGDNNLNEEIHSSICNLTSLTFLYLSKNNLKGKILQCLGNISYLQYVIMSHTNLSGELPSSICNWTSLQILNLGRNNLKGAIPQCFGYMSGHLVVLDMQHNSLSGTLPMTFRTGTLGSFNLHGNKLKGKIPQTLANCKELLVLDLGANDLNDVFPMWLGRVLSLRSNKLHGPIRTLGSENIFLQLQMLDIYSNAFTENLPMSLFQHLKATRTIVTKTHTVAVITKELELEVVKILFLYTTIDLSNNKFEGHIPTIMGDLIALCMLNLSHNGLQGDIPPSLGSLSSVESLDLSSNYLVGEIPAQLASLTSLEVLNLSYNHLEGCIPQGTQLQTFVSNSYKGNDRLRGLPVSRNCGYAQILDTNDTVDFLKGALMGYGSGLCIGLSILYFMISTGKLIWLARIIVELDHKMIMGRRKKQRRQMNQKKK
ncbi:hypothetical protein R3W88_019925 [Solanum pinnatisectum]|uniref:Leucine-rich repeat-containing N-terminal plant-type domain-containing protein n=1 Tax=Solanum pinnatisectum TaxID=50273 RepID=A0AAV9KLJ6_9SOLN|nr:hypothetical protein R3W88_019925 [Solanum pinnatisectum]